MKSATRILPMLMGVLAAGLLSGGCQKPEAPVELTSAPVTIDQDDGFNTLWSACRDTLQREQFRTSRVDPAAGIITTWPVTSQQFFEFWRKDVLTAWDFAEASLHTMRRRVTVEVQRPEGGDATVVVTVRKERLSAPDRQYNSSAAAFRTFSYRSASESTGRPIRPGDDIWIDAGRDGAMEQRLLDKILRQYQLDLVAYAEPQ